MELVPIFEGESPDEDGGLWAIRYPEKEQDEFSRLFDLWTDPEYVYQFCEAHQAEMDIDPYGPRKLRLVAENIIEEAIELEEMLIKMVRAGFAKTGQNLQHLFKPLDNRVYELQSLQASKASAKTRFRREPWLRIYAIRLAPNLYIVTGGAIKITHRMEDAPHTREELAKINRVIRWMRQQGLFDQDDLIENNE